MNRKIFLGVAIAVLVTILGGILLVGPTMVISPQGETSSETQGITQVEPLQVELVDLSVTKISERSATIKIGFKISNPNPRAVIVQTMDYQLFATEYSNSEQIAGGEIGSRPTGMVEFGSNYYVLLGDNAITLKETITLKGSENTPELWAILKDSTTTWRISGDVFYNLSSITSGQENELHFEFTR
jgi:LEA14-like dessication related protein